MRIRKATPADVETLYQFALRFPELKVSATAPFMWPEEFREALADTSAVVLIAEEDTILGFVYARTRDLDRPSLETGCIVYLAVDEKHRNKGIGTQLFNACVKELKARGVTYLFAWANAENSLVKKLLLKEGFAEGHTYTWMDRKI